MTIEVVDATTDLAHRGADVIAVWLRAAVADRGVATLAVSGGRTPGDLLAELATRDVPWAHLHLIQVDERLAPDGHGDRNLELLRRRFLDHRPLPDDHVHLLPVDDPDPLAAAARFSARLAAVAGSVIDVVQLGLGADGHTASLVPGDPAVEVTDRDVALTDVYQGRRRLTLTLPVLARARRRLWVIGGHEKAWALARVLAGDRSLPAARVPGDDSVWLVDRDAAAELPAHLMPGPTQDPATGPTRDPATNPTRDPATGPTQDPATDPTSRPIDQEHRP